VVLVAKSTIKLELGCLKLKITLTFTIRHQYQCGEEPQLHYQKQMDTFVDICNNGLMLRSFTIVIFMDDYLFLVEWCSVQKWRGAIQVNRASPNT
jgi:hypothetical protein